MKKYQITVSFGDKGYTVHGSIFKVIWLILKETGADYIEVKER